MAPEGAIITHLVAPIKFHLRPVCFKTSEKCEYADFYISYIIRWRLHGERWKMRNEKKT